MASLHRDFITDAHCYFPDGKVDWAELYSLDPNFFLKVNKLPDADLLMAYLAPFDPEILTAEPNRWKWPWCPEHKRAWIKEKFGDHFETIVVPHALYKQEYCLDGSCVLIDDSELNIQQWKSRGGIGILHTSSLDSIHQLQDLGISLSAFIPQEY